MPFAIVLLASQVLALTETKPPATRPKNGQLDHFSVAPQPVSVGAYVLVAVSGGFAHEDSRLHLPHLRAPSGLHLPHLRGPSAERLRKVAKAAPVVAVVLNEIPAVREQHGPRLSDWLGRDVPAASGVASDIIRFGASEARRLGDNVLETVRQPVQAVSRKVGAVAKELEKDLDETVVLAEHKAEELIHHKPKAPRRFSPWLVGTLWFAAALGILASRRWAARRRGPAMAGSRRARRNSPTAFLGPQIPPVSTAREGVLQRAPSQSQLTPVKVHKVEFQRVGVQDGADWDSPDEQDGDESPQDARREPEKLSPNTEYYKMHSQQDSPREERRNDLVLGA
ncbi:rlmJ [Symbiodinium natans]|uniref:RlmJ protein n=1 Tax=Symbiodinium natans TaxID=878477 RepID=A0A812Q7E6_9DINO|nr:rlmJ [Symbiodinium natans]